MRGGWNARHDMESRKLFDGPLSSMVNLAEMTACIQTNNIDCDLRLHEGTDVFYDQASYQQSVHALNDMKQHAPELAAYYTIYTRSEALARFKCAEGCVGAIGCPSASLWPYKFVSSLIKKSMDEQNLYVQTNTRVLSVSDRDNDDYAVVKTDRGNIRATHVIHATNAWLGHLLPELRPFISPVRGNVTRQTSPPGLRLGSSFWLRYASKDYDYLIQSPTGEFILGRANTGRRAVGDDSSIDIAPHAHLGGILPLVLKLSPTSLPRKTEITHAWSGILGFTEDGNPFIGSLAEYGRKHQWVCGGYHGIGMVKAFRSGQVLGSMVLGEKAPFEYPASALVDKKRLSLLGRSLRGSRL